ncbi:hypothetical protein I8746_06145 [Pseudomonas sp. USTB-Z]|uniref:hypothetical protein n=1 Tax=Pseudomonas sp. USTB-Z TaxID=2794351 RepID=UPI001C83759B|nr:hypothetical protein [Pseudomonas sp. USTB-Z]MBX6689174.1 hypothetical protein [Pseudomonas sp. USTB-Z]
MYKIVTYPVRELFDRVWTTPVLQLARQIGVSDVALSKACRKAGILLPRRGHWAKTVEKRPKRPTPPDSAESITFRVLDRSVFPPAPPKAPARPNPSKLNVPTNLADPHPLVREWLRAVRAAEDFEGRVELRRVRVLYTRISRDMVDRAALILDTLIKDAEKKGCTWVWKGSFSSSNLAGSGTFCLQSKLPTGSEFMKRMVLPAGSKKCA